MRLLHSDPSDTPRDRILRAAIWFVILMALGVLAAVAGPWFAGATAGRPG